jgi:hypothetical protein
MFAGLQPSVEFSAAFVRFKTSSWQWQLVACLFLCSIWPLNATMALISSFNTCMAFETMMFVCSLALAGLCNSLQFSEKRCCSAAGLFYLMYFSRAYFRSNYQSILYFAPMQSSSLMCIMCNKVPTAASDDSPGGFPTPGLRSVTVPPSHSSRFLQRVMTFKLACDVAWLLLHDVVYG